MSSAWYDFIFKPIHSFLNPFFTYKHKCIYHEFRNPSFGMSTWYVHSVSVWVYVQGSLHFSSFATQVHLFANKIKYSMTRKIAIFLFDFSNYFKIQVIDSMVIVWSRVKDLRSLAHVFIAVVPRVYNVSITITLLVFFFTLCYELFVACIVILRVLWD